jgi:peptidoglycan/LPS O-acetylase OafA/YrhL
MNKKDMGYKPSLSIIGGVGWLIFIILWLAFYAGNYSWEKNFAIILLSILVIFLLLGGMWAIWGLRMMPKEGWEMFKIHGFRWRVLTSIIIPFVAMIFLIIWLWYYGTDYNVWQNIAVILVTLLVLGGIFGVMWSQWGTKYGKDMKKFEKMCEENDKEFEEKCKGKSKKSKN